VVLQTGETEMKMFKSLAIAAAMLGANALATPAMAQELPVKNGSVWVASRIDTLPGQMPAYLDYLATEWKKQNEFLKSEGVLLSYRVLRTNHARNGEPDLILLLEYKDHVPNAQQEAITKRLEAAMRRDARQGAAGNLEREKIRSLMGSSEYQELILK
jgi:squalene cyclase